MKKLTCAFGMLVFCVSAFAQTCDLANVVKVDGTADEWPMQWEVDKDTKISYNVCWDANNLYVRVMTDDDPTVRKIGLYGFYVWFDVNGNKKRKLGVKFPTGSEAAGRMKELRNEAGGDRPMSTGERIDFQRNVNRRLVDNLDLIELVGLADEPVTATRSGITTGLQVAIATPDGNAYIYEAIIPFRTLRINVQQVEELMIGLETSKYTTPKATSKSKVSDADKRPYVPPFMQYETGVWLKMKLKESEKDKKKNEEKEKKDKKDKKEKKEN